MQKAKHNVSEAARLLGFPRLHWIIVLKKRHALEFRNKKPCFSTRLCISRQRITSSGSECLDGKLLSTIDLDWQISDLSLSHLHNTYCPYTLADIQYHLAINFSACSDLCIFISKRLDANITLDRQINRQWMTFCQIGYCMPLHFGAVRITAGSKTKSGSFLLSAIVGDRTGKVSKTIKHKQLNQFHARTHTKFKSGQNIT